MHKTAQERKLSNYFKDFFNVSGKFDEWKNSMFGDIMDLIRQKDAEFRNNALKTPNIKKLVEEAKSKHFVGDITGAFVSASSFNDRLQELFDGLDEVRLALAKFEEAVIYKDPSAFAYLEKFKQSKQAKQKYNIVKTAGIWDYYKRYLTSEGANYRLLERRSEKYRQMKRDLGVIISNTEKMYEKLLSNYEKLADLMADRDPFEYYKVIKTLQNDMKRYNSIFKDYYNRHMKDSFEAFAQLSKQIDEITNVLTSENVQSKDVEDFKQKAKEKLNSVATGGSLGDAEKSVSDAAKEAAKHGSEDVKAKIEQVVVRRPEPNEKDVADTNLPTGLQSAPQSNELETNEDVNTLKNILIQLDTSKYLSSETVNLLKNLTHKVINERQPLMFNEVSISNIRDMIVFDNDKISDDDQSIIRVSLNKLLVYVGEEPVIKLPTHQLEQQNQSRSLSNNENVRLSSDNIRKEINNSLLTLKEEGDSKSVEHVIKNIEIAREQGSLDSFTNNPNFSRNLLNSVYFVSKLPIPNLLKREYSYTVNNAINKSTEEPSELVKVEDPALTEKSAVEVKEELAPDVTQAENASELDKGELTLSKKIDEDLVNKDVVKPIGGSKRSRKKSKPTKDSVNIVKNIVEKYTYLKPIFEKERVRLLGVNLVKFSNGLSAQFDDPEIEKNKEELILIKNKFKELIDGFISDKSNADDNYISITDQNIKVYEKLIKKIDEMLSSIPDKEAKLDLYLNSLKTKSPKFIAIQLTKLASELEFCDPKLASKLTNIVKKICL